MLISMSCFIYIYFVSSHFDVSVLLSQAGAQCGQPPRREDARDAESEFSLRISTEMLP